MNKIKPHIYLALFIGLPGQRQPHDAELHPDGTIWPRGATGLHREPLATAALVELATDMHEGVNAFPDAARVIVAMDKHDEDDCRLILDAHRCTGSTDDLLRELAVARRVAEVNSEVQRRLVEEVKSSLNYQAADERARRAREQAATLDHVVRARAVLHFRTTGAKTVNDTLKVREETRLIYNEAEAVTWAQVNLPAAFKFDRAVFEQYVRAMERITPVSFVRIERVPTGTIGKNLPDYLPTEERAVAGATS